VRIHLDDSSFCFINSHLAAHQSNISARNNDISSVLKESSFRVDSLRYQYVGGGDGSMILDCENIFFFGDLNYRIDLSRPKVMELIESKNWLALQVKGILLILYRNMTSF
jgi:hypothetical protein